MQIKQEEEEYVPEMVIPKVDEEEKKPELAEEKEEEKEEVEEKEEEEEEEEDLNRSIVSETNKIGIKFDQVEDYGPLDQKAGNFTKLQAILSKTPKRKRK